MDSGAVGVGVEGSWGSGWEQCHVLSWGGPTGKKQLWT